MRRSLGRLGPKRRYTTVAITCPMAIKATAKVCSRQTTTRSKGRLSRSRHLLPSQRRKTRGMRRAIQQPPNIFSQSPSSPRSLAGVRFDKALESVDSVAQPDPRQWSACQTGHCFVREGRYTRTSELLQAAFTFVDVVLKIDFSNELGIVRRCNGRRITALSDTFPRSHIKDKSEHTLKHGQEQQYFMGLHVRARPSSQKINTLQVQAFKKETGMKCCHHCPTIFR